MPPTDLNVPFHEKDDAKRLGARTEVPDRNRGPTAFGTTFGARRRYLSTSLGFAFPARARRKSSAATLAVTDQLHTSTLRPGTCEKCLRLLVTTIIPWETACEAMRRSIFPICLPERSNSVRIRA